MNNSGDLLYSIVRIVIILYFILKICLDNRFYVKCSYKKRGREETFRGSNKFGIIDGDSFMGVYLYSNASKSII